MDIHDPICIYTLSDPVRADLIKNTLQEEGIRCVLEGHDQAIFPGFIAVDIKVLVEAGDADRASRLIKEHEEHKGH
jgi:Putative prokaryotic signal transducing protein